jgi:hypothetical protein
MTKTELQLALAAATETDKRIAGVFLDTLSTLAYKAGQKEWRVCMSPSLRLSGDFCGLG